MPKTGSLVMIDEICDIVAIWTVCHLCDRADHTVQRAVPGFRESSPDPCHSRMCGDRRTVYGEHGSGSCVRPGDGSIDGYTGQQIPGAYRYLFASLLSDRNGQPGENVSGWRYRETTTPDCQEAAASRLNITDIPGGS